MEIIDNNEYVTCRICGEQCRRIYGKHLKFAHSGMTTKEYKDLFPNAPIMALSDRKNTTKNSGSHMKEEKYKKIFSERYKGENNPNHKSKTTPDQRKSRSPFSKSFSKYYGVENAEECRSNFIKKAIADRSYNTSIEYYIKKGYSEEDAKKMLTERQRTFSLEKCISKHGDIEGRRIWMERQEKWLKNYKKVNYSDISQEFFIRVYEYLKEINFQDKVYFAKLDPNDEIHNTNRNYEFRLKLNNSYILPDFFIPSLKLIVEFDGTYYHRETTENKKREEKRNTEILKSGYNVLHINELDYRFNKDNTVSILIEKIKQMNDKNINKNLNKVN